ncbi:MAG: tetratricopeptide repeat protein [Bacteroidia bacterium]|nr:tetratricopeptide repeat protein [Bacteroidia bacterium]
MKRICISLFFLIFSFVLSSQNKYDKTFYLIDIASDYVFNPSDKHDVDSVLRLYHATKNDTLRMYYLRVFSEGLNTEYLWTRYNRLMYKRSLEKDDSLFKFYRGCALNNIGYELQYIKNDLEGAKKNYHEAYRVFTEINNGSGLGVEINNLAYIYQHEGNIQKAVDLYTEAGKFFERLNQPLGLTSIYLNLADIYFTNEELEKADEFSKKALEYALRADQKLPLANVYNQLGAINIKKENPSKAIEYYTKALDIYTKENDSGKQALVCIGLSNAYLKQKNQAQYEDYVLRAYGYSIFAADLQIKAKIYDKLALMYIAKKDYTKAGAFADSAYMFAKKLSYADLVASAAQDLSEIYKNKQDYQRAFLFLSEAKRLQDSLKSDAAKKSIIKSQYQMEYNKKSIELKSEQDKKDAIRASEKRQQQIILTLTFIALTVIAGFGFVAFKNYRKVKKQNVVIENQKALVDEKQKEILDSISYAKRLQEAILPPKKIIDSHLAGSFVYYKPKDIVAGDFYWAEKVDDLFFIAAADSTGHGVPGALVSVVCSNALNRSVKEFNLRETGRILDKTRDLVIETFAKSNTEVKDGMDISLLCIHLKDKSVTWSGANNPLWYIENGALTEIKADKQPIGRSENPSPFTTHRLKVNPGTLFYLFTDGLADQFGGPNGKKFKYKQFSDLLQSLSKQTLSNQEAELDRVFRDWKGSLEQVDDVCIIGLKV